MNDMHIWGQYLALRAVNSQYVYNYFRILYKLDNECVNTPITMPGKKRVRIYYYAKRNLCVYWFPNGYFQWSMSNILAKVSKLSMYISKLQMNKDVVCCSRWHKSEQS